jgi:hypothetical protein
LEEDGFEIDIVEGLHAKALLSQSIGYKNKNKTHDCTPVMDICSTPVDEFAYKSHEDK